MDSPYQKKVQEYDQSILKQKQSLTQTQSFIIGSTIKKPLNASSSSKTIDKKNQKNQKKQQKQDAVSTLLKNLTELKDTLEDKAKYMQLEHQKQMLVAQNEKEQLMKRVKELKNKDKVGQERIQKNIEEIALHKQQQKKLKSQVDEKEKKLKQIEQEMKELKEENTKVKLENKSLKTDNKFLTKTCDKLLKIKDSQNISNPETLQQKQHKLLSEQYVKHLTEQKIHKETLLRHHHHDLTNKIKLQQLTQQHQELKKASILKIQGLQRVIEEQEVRIQVLQKQNKQLRVQKKQQEQEQFVQKKQIEYKQDIIKELERKLDQCKNMNQLLRVELKQKTEMPMVKEKVGSIIKFKRNYYH